MRCFAPAGLRGFVNRGHWPNNPAPPGRRVESAGIAVTRAWMDALRCGPRADKLTRGAIQSYASGGARKACARARWRAISFSSAASSRPRAPSTKSCACAASRSLSHDRIAPRPKAASTRRAPSSLLAIASSYRPGSSTRCRALISMRTARYSSAIRSKRRRSGAASSARITPTAMLDLSLAVVGYRSASTVPHPGRAPVLCTRQRRRWTWSALPWLLPRQRR